MGQVHRELLAVTGKGHGDRTSSQKGLGSKDVQKIVPGRKGRGVGRTRTLDPWFLWSRDPPKERLPKQPPTTQAGDQSCRQLGTIDKFALQCSILSSWPPCMVTERPEGGLQACTIPPASFKFAVLGELLWFTGHPASRAELCPEAPSQNPTWKKATWGCNQGLWLLEQGVLEVGLYPFHRARLFLPPLAVQTSRGVFLCLTNSLVFAALTISFLCCHQAK